MGNAALAEMEDYWSVGSTNIKS